MSNVIVALDVADARRLTERIRLIAQNVADNVEKLRELVATAKASDVHSVLGYASWTAYLQDVFGDEPLRLARDVRQELVAELAAQGMSTRAIAPIVGVDRETVAADIRGGRNLPPAPRPVVQVITADAATGETLEADDDDAPTRSASTVTGLDGKSYPRAASVPRRSSIVDEASDQGLKVTE